MYAAFIYNFQGLPTRQNPPMFIVDHPFRLAYLQLIHRYVPALWSLIRLGNRWYMQVHPPLPFFNVHESFLWHCLRVSTPKESPSIFVTSNTCDILFRLNLCGYLQTVIQIMSTANSSNVALLFRPPKSHMLVTVFLYSILVAGAE